MKSKLFYLRHKEIDISKWDECIKNSLNHLIYGLSWYLDCVCPEWEAIVYDDYKAVMPIPVKKKYGLSIMVQPHFTQQLGIFSTFSLHNEEIKQFFEAIPKRFIKIEQSINAKNDLYPVKNMFNIIERPTLIVNLYRPYEVLEKEFSTSNIKNIKKAQAYNLRLKFDTNLDDFMHLATDSLPLLSDAYLKSMRKVIFGLRDNGFGECIGVYHEGNLVAGAIIVRSFNRFIYLISASTEKGKKMRSMFYLIDEFFKTHCEQKRSFDFEGSTIPEIAEFYRGFGAKPEIYSFITYNRLLDPFRKLTEIKYQNH